MATTTTVTTKGVELNRSELEQLITELNNKEKGPQVGDVFVGASTRKRYVVMDPQMLIAEIAYQQKDKLILVGIEGSVAGQVISIVNAKRKGSI